MKKSTLKNLLFITLPTFLVFFLIAEVVVRVMFSHVDIYAFTGKEKVTHPMSEWAVNAPYFAYEAIPGAYSEGKTVNAQGFISTPNIDLNKKENTKRIVFLGGSSTAGTGKNLDDEQTWPWKTTEKLKAATDTKIDFINGALGGYSSFESYGRLWSRLRFYKPDVVVVYHGWNEMYYFNEMADNPIEWKKEFSVSRKVKLGQTPPLWFDPLIRWSQLLTKVRIKLTYKFDDQGEQGQKKELKNDFNPKGLDIFRQNLVLIRDFCNNNGIQLYVGKQATLIAPHTTEEDKKRCKYDYHGFDHEAHIRAFNAVYKVIDEEIPAEQIVDFSHLSGTSEFFFDHIHQTPEGTEVIAEVLKAHLLGDYFNRADTLVVQP